MLKPELQLQMRSQAGAWERVGKGPQPSTVCGLFCFVKPLDDAMQGSGRFYVRYMHDWIVIAESRWKLRKAIKKVTVGARHAVPQRLRVGLILMAR